VIWDLSRESQTLLQFFLLIEELFRRSPEALAALPQSARRTPELCSGLSEDLQSFFNQEKKLKSSQRGFEESQERSSIQKKN
jgi:hypothetical protein